MDKAILVNLATTKLEKQEAQESMEELAGLAESAGAGVVEKIFQVRARVSPKFLLGKGKVEEIARLRTKFRADVVIFDNSLTPIQQKNLENAFKARVIDRPQLILDIFSQRARSNEGKLQVELAQLSYRLPRLVGKGAGLSRLGAGIRTRGPGEQKLEEDRRRITDRITKIKKDIDAIQKRRAGQRRSRKTSPVPVVSLVGYTSAGKSTLFNHLSQEKRFTSPKLFATLDPLLRRVTFPDGLYFFLSDTVGFIKKLPIELITSFRATLEELREADAICHIIDATSPYSLSQAEAVDAILADIGVPEIPVLKVFNKIDLLPASEKADLLRRNDSAHGLALYISAKTGEGIPRLMEKLREVLFKGQKPYYLRIPRNGEDIFHSLSKRFLILKRRENGDFLEFKLMADPSVIVNYLPYIDPEGGAW